MKKRVIACMCSLLGIICLGTYITTLLNRIGEVNSSGIIGGSDYSTLLFVVKESPILVAALGIFLLILGISLSLKKH